MSYLVLYKFPPENGVTYFLKKNLESTGLAERGIIAQVIQGHPLFVSSNNSEAEDKFFPAIGVEWITDTRKDFISLNFNEFPNYDALRADFQAFKEIPKQDRSVSDEQLDKLTQAKLLQRWTHMVESKVVIAGFTSGGKGRTTLRALYETLDGILEPISQDIMENFQGVKVDIEKDNQMNISAMNQFGNPVWGFEIGLRITQPRTTIRSKIVYPENEIKGFDVYIRKSRTIFKEIGGFFDTIRGSSTS